MNLQLLHEARLLLEEITPLSSDCGILCGKACCSGSDEDGVLLLVGEAALYQGADWCRVASRGGFDILFCGGRCPRGQRPFFCRLFPLMVRFKRDGVPSLSMDPMARALCPLAHQGTCALSPAFVQAARAACALLLGDAQQKVLFLRYHRVVQQAMAHPLFSE
jgi:hypothetical protein